MKCIDICQHNTLLKQIFKVTYFSEGVIFSAFLLLKIPHKRNALIQKHYGVLYARSRFQISICTSFTILPLIIAGIHRWQRTFCHSFWSFVSQLKLECHTHRLVFMYLLVPACLSVILKEKSLTSTF